MKKALIRFLVLFKKTKEKKRKKGVKNKNEVKRRNEEEPEEKLNSRVMIRHSQHRIKKSIFLRCILYVSVVFSFGSIIFLWYQQQQNELIKVDKVIPKIDQPQQKSKRKPKRLEPKQQQIEKQEQQAQIKKSSSKEKQRDQQQDQQQHKPLNVLVLYPDDWRHDSIGGVGPVVQTPFLSNILSREGIRFTHNCVTTSICWISRATYFTGQYASRHESYRLMKPYPIPFYTNTFINNHTSWPSVLRDHGYYTGHIGKWQYSNRNSIVNTFFNWTSIHEGSHWYKYADRTTGKQVRKHATERARDDVYDFLKQRPKDKPFALTVAFYPPKAVVNERMRHIPGHSWSPKNDTTTSIIQQIENSIIPQPNDTFKSLPYFFHKYEKTGRNGYISRFTPNTTYQIAMKRYYQLIYNVDTACKDIINKLKELNIYDNTLIIFTTDNGFFHGEHGLTGKWYPYQESIRVPLIIRDPRMSKSKWNSLLDDYTLNIDLAPTIVSAAGLNPPNVMQGQDISKLYLQNQQQASTTNNNNQERKQQQQQQLRSSPSSRTWRKEFYYEFPLDQGKSSPMATALVRKDFKYIMWPQFTYEQLFHLLSDPMEENDLINKTEYKDIVNEMRKRHDELAASVR